MGRTAKSGKATDVAAFMRANMRLVPVPNLSAIQLYAPHARTGLHRLAHGSSVPYWAFPWAGGLALARYILDQPAVVAGKRVLDLGSGSGLVAIAAAKSGAASVLAADAGRYATEAIALNAAANGVEVATTNEDMTGAAPPAVDAILAGDVFYDEALAQRMTAFFDRCIHAGRTVLVGDPGRRWLPLARLRRLAAYPVADFGDSAPTVSTVYVFQPSDSA